MKRVNYRSRAYFKNFLAGVSYAVITGSALAAGFTPVDIPLSIVQIQDGGSSLNKIGLYAYVGGTGSSAKFYQLDTGSSGFFAAYAPTESLDSGVTQWWGTEVTNNHISGVAGYGSGVSLNFDVVTTSVTLSNSTGASLVTINNVQMGRVETASQPSDWQQVTEAGNPALHSEFYGNFGVALNPHSTHDSNTNLFALLGQIPGANGFVVHIGNIATPDPSAPAKLTVGITDAMRAEFAYSTPMVLDPEGRLFPTTGYQATEEYNSTVTYVLSKDGHEQTLTSISTLLDVGAPSTEIRENVDDVFVEDGKLKDGVTLSMIFPGTNGSDPLTITYAAGSIQSVNQVGIGDASTNNVNAGLNPYAYVDVMFDLEQGVMRFRPIPEPSTYALAGLAVASLLLWRVRRCLS